MSRTSDFILTEEMIEQFYREGFFYAPGFITAETAEAVNREHEIFSQANGDGKWRSTGITSIQEERTRLPNTTRFLTSAQLVSAFERILGGEVRFWLGMFAVVSPHGEGLQWHQDNQYTHILGHMLNCFIALDHITQDNAGLWLSPRSHRLGRQANLNTDPNEPHKRAAEPDNGIPCEPMAPGDAIIFHRETLHHSKRNHTDAPRRAYAFQVAHAGCRLAETGKLLDRESLSAYAGSPTGSPRPAVD